MARIPTGEYGVMFFNKYGERLKDLDQQGRSITGCQKVGKETLESNPEIASFSIIRAVYNSLDEGNKWDIKQASS